MSAVPADRSVAQLPLFRRLPAARRPPDIHAISIPARAFTGDFYFVHRATDRLWFALGDVAGKGINAAVIMAMIQEELESMTRCDPAIAMQRLHAFLRPLIPRNRFATAVIGDLSDDGRLVMANAGHCSPLIARTDGTIERVASTGPVVGALPASRWNSFETTLVAGETLVLYSDGVLEARSPQGEDLGIERIALSVGPAPAGQIAETILAAVRRHAGDVLEDDLTLVVVRR